MSEPENNNIPETPETEPVGDAHPGVPQNDEPAVPESETPETPETVTNDESETPEPDQMQMQYGDAPPPSAKTGPLFAILGGLAGALILVLMLVFALGGGGDGKIALDYVRGQIDEAEMAELRELGMEMDIDFKLVAENKAKNLYIIDFIVDMAYMGETAKGGSMMVVKVDGKDAEEIMSYSYGELSWTDTSRSEALDMAKEYVTEY
jgi:hypothetical protein